LYLGGFAYVQDFPERLRADNNAHYFKQAKALSELGDDFISPEDADGLKQLLAEVQAQGHQFKTINIVELARTVNLEALYHVVFRKLSGEAAHVSLSSVERYFHRGPHQRVEKLVFRPTRDGLTSTLSAAVTALLGCLSALVAVFPRPDIIAILN